MGSADKFGARTPAGFERHEYVINGVRTIVNVGGAGQPVLYLHGAGNWHGIDFVSGWLDRLQIIAPSHPGFGDSDDAPPEMSSMSDYVLHYLELMEAMGLQQVSLLGISMGGWMAAEFALAYRQMVRKLVLVAPAGLNDPDHPTPPGVGRWTLQEMYGFLVEDQASVGRHLPSTPEEHAAHAAQVAREARSTFKLLTPGVPYPPRLERWMHRITMPTLLAWSKADRLTPVGRHKKWMRLLPNAQLLLVERGGHLTLDESSEVRDAVVRFLA
jgi:pimeloyl-ACP methyl ester carboxylesterase